LRRKSTSTGAPMIYSVWRSRLAAPVVGNAAPAEPSAGPTKHGHCWDSRTRAIHPRSPNSLRMSCPKIARTLQRCSTHFLRLPTRPWSWRYALTVTTSPRRNIFCSAVVFSQERRTSHLAGWASCRTSQPAKRPKTAGNYWSSNFSVLKKWRLWATSPEASPMISTIS